MQRIEQDVTLQAEHSARLLRCDGCVARCPVEQTTFTEEVARAQVSQHFTFAMPHMPWLETFVGSPPGVPIAEARGLHT